MINKINIGNLLFGRYMWPIYALIFLLLGFWIEAKKRTKKAINELQNKLNDEKFLNQLNKIQDKPGLEYYNEISTQLDSINEYKVFDLINIETNELITGKLRRLFEKNKHLYNKLVNKSLSKNKIVSLNSTNGIFIMKKINENLILLIKISKANIIKNSFM